MKTKMKILAMTALSLATLAAGSAAAQEKKTLAIVVKGLDNPFFEQINLGCKKWMSENADSEYECLYTGPASSPDVLPRLPFRRQTRRPWQIASVRLRRLFR